ncbi:helix-turn-helix transcriptional regulator [Flavobacterium sp. MAH-1]|uniref:Helix-turn-helix transcriptional regulator n=1 Tax=Flavobacterium agri TaxID=2743471 RepID=A0A7Y8Y0Q1_9FLAO|nr:helix-turn-helix transcriptional regulator [Flavobacterium agri]NUY80260.1 helix-turn-helix transcriptional regulator [Flavobacterium agri]NYA70285.1 helix-turn-helix transcriptional regulator [Flavobacterium agri]
MNTATYVRTQLNLSQQEMSTLLNISRSHYSMIELGRRDLHLAGQQLLAELLVFSKGAVTITKKTPKASDHSQLRNHLQNELLENDYQRALASRQIASLKEKQETALRRSQLAAFLQQRNAGKPEVLQRNLDAWINKMSKTSTKDTDTELPKLELRLELLELEEKFLRSKLDSPNSRP